VVLFAGVQLALSVFMDTWQPAWRDPEYAYKKERLLARLAEAPGRPLVLVVGSSRAALGFRPEFLSGGPAAGAAPPLVFNFGLTGAGPLMELLCLRRLLADGVRPDAVVLEVLPALLHQEGDDTEESRLNINRLGWSDLAVLRRYWSRPWLLYRHWCRSRLVPCFSHRFTIRNRCAGGFAREDHRQAGWHNLDAYGWASYPRAAVSPEQYRRGVELARGDYGPRFEHFRITDVPDRALREALDVCRRRGIRALLVLMPESREFQDWYRPVRPQIDAYLDGLSREYGARRVDARDWVPDRFFGDGHHLLPEGAARFTREFARRVGAWLDGDHLVRAHR
jgi:hypothetical protein